MPRRTRSLLWLSVIVCLTLLPGTNPLGAQAKKAIGYEAYNAWKSIQGVTLSSDGTWLAYTLMPQDGDPELVVRNLTTGAESRHARGRDAVITADSAFVVFTVAAPKAEVDKAKKAKKKPEEQPKNGLGVLTLASGQVFTAERVKNVKVPEDSGRAVAYLLEAPEKKADAKPDATAETPPEPKGDAPKKPREKKKDPGTDLVVRELASGAQVTIAEVVEYAWSKNAAYLAYGTSSTAKTPEKDGAFVRKADGTTVTLVSGLGHYKGFVFDEASARLAFLSDRESYTRNPATFRLYLWTPPAAVAAEVAGGVSKGLPDGMVVSEHGRLEFSKDGARLLFGYSRPPEAEPDEDAPEPVKVDIWHYRDAFLQPMQKVRADADKKRSYRALLHLADSRIVPLASEDMPEVAVNDNAATALGASDVAYRQLVSWDAEHNDYYAVSLTDGSRRKVIEKARFSAALSPGGAYALVFGAEDGQWYAAKLSDGTKVNLTAPLGVRFDDESADTPEPARAYGSAGWTTDDRSVLLYDKYDIWEVRPDGTDARCITGGVGRQTRMVFRYVRTDAEARTIAVDQPLLLAATDDVTKATGYYRLSPAAATPPVEAKAVKLRGAKTAAPAKPSLAPGYGTPLRLVMLDKQLGSPGSGPGGGPGGPGAGGPALILKPKKAAGPFVLTAQRFEEFPDLWTSNPDFGNLTRVSNANPQQAQYRWGRSELVSYRNADGKLLRAILTKPDDFDPSRQYPLMVYIYEELTSGLHRYVAPAPGTSINVARYVSHGYVVLQPDIVYDIGFPGESALKCVLPAVQKIVDQGYIDPARIGIQGHSWGGYQITYLITRTDLFRAVQAGASVSNMTSAYGGIRWGTGMSRAFQYERSQSRIGGPPWAKELEFFENSPLFWVEKVNTPYLSIHNDEDDAVPWYQGIEFFSALRRLGKEAYMFNYNGEKHGLRERENQKHWTVHQDEFFDHYLLGAPRPSWMDKGVPYLDRTKRDVRDRYGK